MTDWQPIETAPKDGSTFLAFVPDGVEAPTHLWSWPKEHVFNVVLCRWKVPDKQSEDGPGWRAAMFHVVFGYPDDPSTDFYMEEIDPTHWMPLPAPPPASRG